MTGPPDPPPPADDTPEQAPRPRRGKAPVPPAPPPDKEILSTVEAAGFLGVPARTIQREVRVGHLKARTVGREFRFHRDDLRAWIRGGDGDDPPTGDEPDPKVP